MEQDLNAAAEETRRRLDDLAHEAERLAIAVADLRDQAGPGASKAAAKSLRLAEADLDRSQRALAALKTEYADFRLREALGADPGYIDDDLFDGRLLDLTASRLCRREPRHPRDGQIGLDTFREMMLADLGLGQLLANEDAERNADLIIDGHDGDDATKSILRGWAAHLQSDPFVSERLAAAADAARRFASCLADFNRGLDNLRINYEISQRKVDQLTFVVDGGKPAIHAANYWGNIEELFARECRGCLEGFYGLQQARDAIRQIRDELSTEFRAFFASFAPRYIAYALRQSPARRQRLGLGRLRASRLSAYLLEQADQTDFLLPRGGGLEMAVPRIPRSIAAFRKLKAFRDYKKALDRAALSNAPTVDQKLG